MIDYSGHNVLIVNNLANYYIEKTIDTPPYGGCVMIEEIGHNMFIVNNFQITTPHGRVWMIEDNNHG